MNLETIETVINAHVEDITHADARTRYADRHDQIVGRYFESIKWITHYTINTAENTLSRHAPWEHRRIMDEAWAQYYTHKAQARRDMLRALVSAIRHHRKQ